jgi:hypothetical protein
VKERRGPKMELFSEWLLWPLLDLSDECSDGVLVSGLTAGLVAVANPCIAVSLLLFFASFFLTFFFFIWFLNFFT